MHHRNKTLAAIALAALASTSAFAADSGRSSYEQQRARCLSGQTNQSQADCLKEAGAALDEAKRGRLAEPGADYRQNQQSRCAVLSGEDQAACKARMQGMGKVDGSAASGGIYRELTVVEPATPSAPAVPAPAPK